MRTRGRTALAVFLTLGCALPSAGRLRMEDGIVLHSVTVDSSLTLRGLAEDKRPRRFHFAGIAFAKKPSLRSQAIRLSREFIGGQPVTISGESTRNGRSSGIILVRPNPTDPNLLLRNLGYLLVREGLGRKASSYRGPDLEELKSAERAARADGIGMWAK